MNPKSFSFNLKPQLRQLNRQMQIFATGLGLDSNLYTMWKLSLDPSAAWSDVVNLGNPGYSLNPVFVVSVGYLPDDRMQIFVEADNIVYSMYKLTTDLNSAWSSWGNLGSPPGGAAYGPSVEYLIDGRMQIFVMGNDGNVYTMWKLTTDPSSDWSQWTTLGSAGPAYNIAQITFGVVVGYLLS